MPTKRPTIIPAVDIRGGKCVRLLQGDYSKEKIYDSDPVSAATTWDVKGISFIHVVDLDGAKAGYPVNYETIAKIAKSVNAKIEAGGGIRSEKDVELLLNSGAKRIILGTSICENPSIAASFVKNFGAEKIIAGVDAKNGKAATKGWTADTGKNATDLLANFADSGIIRIIYTDISTDGMMGGPNIKAIFSICESFPELKIISSGGISSIEDIKNLFSSSPKNLEAAIIGKALYEKKFSIYEAVSALRDIISVPSHK
jgi:phosphoribosylformimino-5-aminoimidazole carboxamide ribotide isomerase